MSQQDQVGPAAEPQPPVLGTFARFARVATITVVAVEVVLLVVGRINLGAAVGVLVAVEAALLAAIVTVAWRGVRTRPGDRVAAVVRTVLPGPLATAVLLELGQVRALWFLVRGRTHTEHPEDVTIRYGAGQGGIFVMVGAACVIELLAVHLIVPWHRLGSWSWLQWLALALSAYGVVWLLAWWAAQRTHPHLVTDHDLVLRLGALVRLRIPLHHIGAVGPRRRGGAAEGRLMLGGPDGWTNLDIDLIEPVTWRSVTGRRERQVTAVSVDVDDPRTAAERLGEATRRRPAPPTEHGT